MPVGEVLDAYRHGDERPLDLSDIIAECAPEPCVYDRPRWLGDWGVSGTGSLRFLSWRLRDELLAKECG